MSEDWKEEFRQYWNKESIYTEQKYLTPDTLGIIYEFIEKLLSQQLQKTIADCKVGRGEEILEAIRLAKEQERERLIEEIKEKFYNRPEGFVDKYGSFDNENSWSIDYDRYLDDILSLITNKETEKLK